MISVSSSVTFNLFLMKETKLKTKINKGETVEEFITKVTKQNKRYRELLLDSKGNVRANITIIINSKAIPYENRLSTQLKSGDHIEILPLVKGG